MGSYTSKTFVLPQSFFTSTPSIKAPAPKGAHASVVTVTQIGASSQESRRDNPLARWHLARNPHARGYHNGCCARGAFPAMTCAARVRHGAVRTGSNT